MDNNFITLQDSIIDKMQSDGPQTIYSLIGPNGSGKSRYLKKVLRYCLDNNIPVLPIHSDRNDKKNYNWTPWSSIFLHGSIRDIREQALDYLTHERHEYENNIVHVSIDRIYNIIMHSMQHEDQQSQQVYELEFRNWFDNDREGPEPKKPTKRMKELNQKLKEVFDIYFELYEIDSNLERNSVDPGSVIFKGQRIKLDDLSDGEKQIFMMLVLIFEPSDKKILFLIDEPELHFSEFKTHEFWKKVEEFFPNSLFVYSTHNIPFATRSVVDKIYVIQDGREPTEIARSTEIPLTVLRNMIVARMQITLSDKKTVLCEDELQKHIIQDLFSDKNEHINVEVIGDCGDVIQATNNRNGRHIISTDLPFCGVIDLDHRPNAVLDNLARNKRLAVLPFHEAEAILLHPDFMAPFIANIIFEDHAITKQEYIEYLIRSATNTLPFSMEKFGKQIAKIDISIYNKVDHESNSLVVSNQSELFRTIEDEFKNRYLESIDAISHLNYEYILRHFDSKLLFKNVRGLLLQKSCKIRIDLQEDALKQYRIMRTQLGAHEIFMSIAEIKTFRYRILSALQFSSKEQINER